MEGVNQALLSTTVKRSGVFVIPAAALRDAAQKAELHATTQHACTMHKCSKNLCFYQKDATRDCSCDATKPELYAQSRARRIKDRRDRQT